MITEDNQIKDITFFVSPDGELLPEKDLPINERKLKGFIWRDDERPKNISDLFSDEDKLFELRVIEKVQIPDAFRKKSND